VYLLRYISYFVLIIMPVIILGCSPDDIELAKFIYKNREYTVKIKEVKEELFLTARQHSRIATDFNWHTNYIFANYLSQDIAVLEELNKGLANNPVFKAAYDQLCEKKYLWDLFKQGQVILLKDVNNHTAEDYAQEVKKRNVINLYSCDLNNNTLSIRGMSYKLDKLPDEIILFKVYDKPYTWGEVKRIILLFEPYFTEKIDMPSFQNQMKNLKDLLLFVEAARNAGLDRPNKQEGLDENIVKKIALEQFRRELRYKFAAEILPKVTEQVLRDYYEKNRDAAVEEREGKMTPLTFRQLKDEIYNVVCEEYWQDFVKAWNEEMKKKYNVAYNKEGILILMDMEKEYINKYVLPLGPNLALNKTVKASSEQKNRQLAAMACDGQQETTWSPAATSGPHWIAVDLGKKIAVSSVVLKWGENHPGSFTVQASSDGQDWTDAYTVSAATGGVNRVNEVLLENINQRFIRIFIKENADFSLKELEVYN
jgi:hypothetical protein